jgi:hypothetical protein
MKDIAKIATVAALAFAFATPALAGTNTTSKSARKEMLVRQKACKKEASSQNFGISLTKKRAFIKECMARV